MNAPKATIDFETRSACNLKAHGVWRYSIHSSTEVLCLVWRLPTWAPGRTALWHPEMPALGLPECINIDEVIELFDWIEGGGLVEAHNSFFEYCVWNNIMVPRYGWAQIPLTSWRCSAAKAAAHALPRSLEGAGDALKLAMVKDVEGSKTMKKMAKPRKSRKAERAKWEKEGITPPKYLWHESVELLDRLIAYCRIDVLSEEAISHVLDDLSEQETEMFLMDLRINARGFQIDKNAVKAALRLITQETIVLNQELTLLTDRQVRKATQRARMLAWFAEQGLELFDTQKATIDQLLSEEGQSTLDALDPKVRRALEIIRALGRSSTAKYKSMRDWAARNGRVYGGLLYHGASTGRWCLTGDHEVLTPRGWVRLDEWAGGDIAVWNSAEEISFQKSKALTFPYNGELVHHVSQRLDQLSTPEHSMPYWGVKTGVFGTRRADASGRVAIPYTGSRLNGRSTDAGLLRVLIMTQADGHYAADGSLRFHFAKPRKIERCLRLLRQASITYSHRPNDDGTDTISVPVRHQPLAVRMFQEKVFGWWLLDEDATVVFDELEHWDAYRCGPNSLQYSSVVRQNVDVLQALAHTSGRAASITQKAERNANWKTSHVLSVWLTPSNRHELRQPPTREWLNGFVHCAETTTGFFLVRRNGRVWVTGNSGKGVQPHNFPKPTQKLDIDDIWKCIKRGHRDEIMMAYRSVMEALANALRGAITASRGNVLYVADYAAIEARVVLWLAGDEDSLAIFREGRDIYLEMAEAIYGYPCNKKDHPVERNISKIAVLGLSYAMGASKFHATCQAYGVDMDEAFAKRIVDTYREKFWRVKQFWADLEAAAIKAVKTGKRAFTGRFTWYVQGRFLYCQLPSGRRLAYPYPEVNMVEMSWGGQRESLTFMGVDSYSRKWKRQKTYGGMLVENVTQSVARDIMAEAMLRIEQSGEYRVVLSVHDELIAESPKGLGTVQGFEQMMADTPAWAEDCPVAAEGWSGTRYRKG